MFYSKLLPASLPVSCIFMIMHIPNPRNYGNTLSASNVDQLSTKLGQMFCTERKPILRVVSISLYCYSNCGEWANRLNFVQKIADMISMVRTESVNSFCGQRTALHSLICVASLKANTF